MAKYSTKSLPIAALLNYLALPYTVEVDANDNCIYIFETSVETCAGPFDLNKSDVIDQFFSEEGLVIADAKKLLNSMQFVQRKGRDAKDSKDRAGRLRP